MQCPFCHQDTPENSLFCERCGGNLKPNFNMNRSHEYNNTDSSNRQNKKPKVLFEPYTFTEIKQDFRDSQTKIKVESPEKEVIKEVVQKEVQDKKHFQWKYKKRMVVACIGCLILTAVTIGIATDIFSNGSIPNSATIQKNYENAINYTLKEEYKEAKISLRKAELQDKDYKNLKQISTYVNAKELYQSGSPENYDEVLDIINEIETDYNGDLKLEIKYFKTYILEQKRTYEISLEEEDRINNMNKALDDFVSFMKKEMIDKEIAECPMQLNDYELTYNSDKKPVIIIKPEYKGDKKIKSYKVITLCYDNENIPIHLDVARENTIISADTDGFNNGDVMSLLLFDIANTKKAIPFIYELNYEDGTSWKFPIEYKPFLMEYGQNKLVNEQRGW